MEDQTEKRINGGIEEHPDESNQKTNQVTPKKRIRKTNTQKFIFFSKKKYHGDNLEDKTGNMGGKQSAEKSLSSGFLE